MEEDKGKSMLSGYRALDLTDENGFLCGWLLGSWGVDVIKVEKPGGDSSRRIGPFYHDIPDPEKSLNWFAYNSNKRGITLNLESADGKALFRRLVGKVDFVIESYRPGHMGRLGLGYKALSKINPGLIMVSITGFGQTGPYRNYKAVDMVASALGGYLYRYGDPERAPVKMSLPISYPLAAADAAVGAIIAIYHRGLTGEGQVVDASAQQSAAMNMFNDVPLWLMNQVIVRRLGAYRWGEHGSLRRRQLFPCKDGAVVFSLQSGQFGGRGSRALVEWMKLEGVAEPFLLEIDWGAFDLDTVSQELVNNIEDAFARFFVKHTKKELYDVAVKENIMLGLASSSKDIVESEQLQDRGFWTTVDHPELGDKITYPKPFVKVTNGGCDIWRRAPLIGEHNLEVYEQELSLSRQEIQCLKEGGVI